jgi:hypothetical protein
MLPVADIGFSCIFRGYRSFRAILVWFHTSVASLGVLVAAYPLRGPLSMFKRA